MSLKKWKNPQNALFTRISPMNIDSQKTPLPAVMRSFKLLKHRDRFQMRIAQTFEQLLISVNAN